MAGYNGSLYLKDKKTWENFQKACNLTGKKPNSVLSRFIASYCQEVLEEEMSLENRIALAMIEGEKIAIGDLHGQDAMEFLESL